MTIMEAVQGDLRRLARLFERRVQQTAADVEHFTRAYREGRSAIAAQAATIEQFQSDHETQLAVGEQAALDVLERLKQELARLEVRHRAFATQLEGAHRVQDECASIAWRQDLAPVLLPLVHDWLREFLAWGNNGLVLLDQREELRRFACEHGGAADGLLGTEVIAPRLRPLLALHVDRVREHLEPPALPTTAE